MGTGWVGGTHHTSPAGPAEEAASFFQELDDVELVVVAPNVGLVQSTVVVFMHLWPEGVQGGQAGSGHPRGTWLDADRNQTALGRQRPDCTGVSGSLSGNPALNVVGECLSSSGACPVV